MKTFVSAVPADHPGNIDSPNEVNCELNNTYGI